MILNHTAAVNQQAERGNSLETIRNFFDEYLSRLTIPSIPEIGIVGILEIFIIAFATYHIIVWIKNTRAWMLVKGIIVILVICLIASILEMHVILWIFSNSITVSITAIIIVFQPELRKALEQLGRKDLFRSIIPFDDTKDKNEKFSTRTVNEIIKATFELARAKTGALIVIEQEVPLNEYERTGIYLDSLISSQLLINIFEHNTPLHDGAIILRGDRIVAATCYLPLSDNMELSKELGTRHRAGVGISEVTDSLTVIVSEETGKVSMAYNGSLVRNVDGDRLRSRLEAAQNKSLDAKKRKLWKGRRKA